MDNGFKPLYIVSPDKKAQVAKLKAALKESDELYLATDEDREGEAIAWHLLETLKPKIPVHRMVFHEITKSAIEAAVQNPRALDQDLVDAQETRRILDRLYGYRVSEVLWKKVMPRLSAGRVQSVATRVVVERERARMRFRAAGYWDIEGSFEKDGEPEKLVGHAGAGRRHPARHRPRLRPRDRHPHPRGAAARGARGPRPRREARERQLRGAVGRGQALHPQALRAVHDQHLAAGGRPQAPDDRAARDAHRAAAVRERPHHLHAHRQHQPVGDGDRRGPPAGARPLRPGVRPGLAPQLCQEGEERAGGARGDPPLRRHLQDARASWPARSAATSCGSTS